MFAYQQSISGSNFCPMLATLTNQMVTCLFVHLRTFRVGPDLFRWPDCPAYWSFDSSGATRLSTEDAKNLGFPIIHIETVLQGYSWDSSVYDGLRQFHRGKGFDPDSQEAAIHYGYPLYELSSEAVGPLACVEIKHGFDCNQEDTTLCQTFGHYL
ncbi:hypothetical protein B0H14DRAFT_690080 [Mycena olivaceomarginata]|nr:hypothetical protein B0H14DRAFT_690080 [Mycena olivaceomarginata]